MALEQVIFNIAAFSDADAGGNNYYASKIYTIHKSEDDTLAFIYSDSGGLNEIIQNGIANRSNDKGEAVFYVDGGVYYITVNGESMVFSVGALNLHNEDPSAHPELSAFITSEADRAETAADAATISANVYETTTVGLAATVDGDYFSVVSPDDGSYLDLYKNNAGVAELKKSYPTVEFVKSKVDIDNFDTLVTLKDAQGKVFAYFDREGGLNISNVKGSVQDHLLTTQTDDKSDILTVLDKNGDAAMIYSESGVLLVNDVLTSTGSMSKHIQNQAYFNSEIEKSINDSANYLTTYRAMDETRTEGMDKTNSVHVLIDADELPDDYKSVFGPAIDRIGKNTYFVAVDARSTGGDHDPIYVVGRKVTFNPQDRTFTKGPLLNLAMNGELEDGTPYAFLNPMTTFVKNGVNAGRILVHFNYMTNPDIVADRVFAPYYVYSDDGGETFTPPINMSNMFPMDEWGGVLNFGPGHGIQIKNGKFRDRIVLPAYIHHPNHLNDKIFCSIPIISEDGGDTFFYGEKIASPIGLNEWQVDESPAGGLFAILRMRSGYKDRYTATSEDGGVTFTLPTIQKDITGVGTKTGTLSASNEFDFSVPKLFAACPRVLDENGEVIVSAAGRYDPHLWISYDAGKTWPIMKKIASGVCHYCDITTIDTNHILLIYNGGVRARGNQVLAHDINLSTILEKKL